MKKLLILFVGFCAGIITTLVIHANNLPDYEINLIDQDTTQIKSNLSHKVYFVTPDKVTETFEIDNL